MNRTVFSYQWIASFLKPSSQVSEQQMKSAIENNVKKFGKTYDLLSEYDRKNLRDPEVLAKPLQLQNISL